MNILGISAYYHDSAAALICDGKIVAAAQEERFTRKKHDATFPAHAIRFCLDFGEVEVNEVDLIVFYDKPFLKFERLLESYYNFIPSGIVSFVTAMPVWIREKLFLKRVIREELQKLGSFDPKKQKLLFSEHHLSHAASAFFTSPFRKAVIVTIDGVGEWTTASISLGNENVIKLIKELRFPHSIGLLYSSFTYFLGFTVNSGEYKLMGLAPYGNPLSQAVKRNIETIKTHLVSVKDDGSIGLNQQYFSYATSLKMIPERKWEKLFGFERRRPEDQLRQCHCDLAYAIQAVTEEIVLKFVRHAQTYAEDETQNQYLCLAGGVALNCVINGKLQANGWFRQIYIQPASGDAGGAIGAALAVYHIYSGRQRTIEYPDSMQGGYLGPEFSEREIRKTLRRYSAAYHYKSDFQDLCDEVASFLSEGKVVGWFQDRMEFGPRALGNRSILGDARLADMQKRLNLKIKYRESFRPFAPSVLAEEARNYFKIEGSSAYMLSVAGIQEAHREAIPENYWVLPLMERLYFRRSVIPAITHVDYSARVQTVHKNTNEKFWQLIDTYRRLTGCPLLVNTSFNVRGEPIVCSPEDAYKCFMRSGMDYLVLGNYVLEKGEQSAWGEKERDKEFALD